MKTAADYFIVPNSYYGRGLGLFAGLMLRVDLPVVVLMVALGFALDYLITRIVIPRQYRQRRRQLCSESILALCAKAMCAGGTVTASAMQALRKQLLVVAGQSQLAMDVIEREKKSLDGFEEHAARLVQMLAHHPQDLDLLMRALVIIVEADGPINDGEEFFLLRVAGIIGIREERLLELVRSARQFKQKQDTRVEAKPQPNAGAYRVLGLGPDAKWEDIRKAYRRLVHAHHPDKLQSSGKSAAEMKRAEAEMARINEAYATLEAVFQKKDAHTAN